MAVDPVAPLAARDVRTDAVSGAGALPAVTPRRELAAIEVTPGAVRLLKPDASVPFRAPPPKALLRRREALLAGVRGPAMIVLPAAAEIDRAQMSHFRQSNNLYYLTGLESPDSWLVLTKDAAG